MSEPTRPYVAGDGAPAAAAPIPTEPGYYWAFAEGWPPEVVEIPAPGVLYRAGLEPDADSLADFARDTRRYVGPLTPPSPTDG